MGSKQGVNASAANRLNALEKQLLAVAKQRDAAIEKYDALYRQAWLVFDQELGEGSAARFVCADGYVLGRQVRRQSPTFDANKLIELVKSSAETPLKAARMLTRIVVQVPTVDQAKLAEEVKLGRLDASVVQKCATFKPPVLAKYPLREANAKERLNLEHGVIESPSDEEDWAS